jgi:hypothetical protein
VSKRHLCVVVAIVLAATGLARLAFAAPGGRAALADAVAATARFHDLDAAKAAGYGEFRDAAGIACIESAGVGGMGVHYVKGALVGDGAVDPRTPEALVYEPRADGKLHLVALEYVVIASTWTQLEPPSLFGREFDFVDSPNRYGLPPFYALHAWIFKPNPSGDLQAWNPRVDCP